MANELPGDVIRIVIDNRAAPPAQVVLNWADGIVGYFAESFRLEREQIALRHLGLGSTSLELWFLGLVAAGTVGQFAVALTKAMRAGDQRIAGTTVYIINQYQGQSVSICHGAAEPTIIQRDQISLGDNLSAFPRTGDHDGDVGGGKNPQPIFDEAGNELIANRPDGLMELKGRIVTTHGGRFAIFRTGTREYQIVKPEDLLQQIPIGEDIIVVAEISGEDSFLLSIHDWRLVSDDEIDWENVDGLPGVQVEKLKALEARESWPSTGMDGSLTRAPDESSDIEAARLPGEELSQNLEEIDGDLLRARTGDYVMVRGDIFRLLDLPEGDWNGAIKLSGAHTGRSDHEGNPIFQVNDIEEY